jgi:hypothetical protein
MGMRFTALAVGWLVGERRDKHLTASPRDPILGPPESRTKRSATLKRLAICPALGAPANNSSSFTFHDLTKISKLLRDIR